MLIRTDGAGSSPAFLDWLTGQRLSCTVGFALPHNTPQLLALMDEDVWTPAYSSAGGIREWAWVAELPGLLNLGDWPCGMRVMVRKERPHPGAKLLITDADGLRVTAFATNTSRGQLPDLELRHRRRARVEDRIRCAKDTGRRNLPLPSLNSNRIWRAIATLATEITARMQLIALKQQQRAPVGTQETPPAPVHHRRRPDPAQPTDGADPESQTTLGGTCPRRGHRPSGAARPRVTPAAHPPTSDRTKAPGPWTRRPPEPTPGKQSHPDATISVENSPNPNQLLLSQAMKDPG